MQSFLFIFVIFIFSQVSFAQVKIDEYARTDSDSESVRLDSLFDNLQKEPAGSKALIVVYSGEKEKSLGAALRHIEGIKAYVSIRFDGPAEQRFFYQITEGKSPLYKEFWLYAKDASLPAIEAKSVGLDNLRTKYPVGAACIGCDPAIYTLSGEFGVFQQFAEYLKKYPNHRGLIVIEQISAKGWSRKKRYQSALKFAADFRRKITEEYKINNRRLKIKIAAPIASESPEIAKFYIVPKSAVKN